MRWQASSFRPTTRRRPLPRGPSRWRYRWPPFVRTHVPLVLSTLARQLTTLPACSSICGAEPRAEVAAALPRPTGVPRASSRTAMRPRE
eukprot:scaffold186890_cov30-Tisochrysis_lutea.AAC.3